MRRIASTVFFTVKCYLLLLTPTLSSLQFQWVKACGQLANFVLANGDEAIKVLEQMETTMTIAPSTFRCLEGIIVPADYNRILVELQQLKQPTPSGLREIATNTMVDRWLQWTLLHPDIGPDQIHPTRSMLLRFFLGGKVVSGNETHVKLQFE